MSKELTQEALRMAIEAMDWELGGEPLPTLMLAAKEACKAALDSKTLSADLQRQEPVAWMSDNNLNVTKHKDIAESWKQHGGRPIPLYTKPTELTVIWKNAAIRVGEELSTVGPDNYYAFTPQQWMEWALHTIRSTK